MTNSDLKRRIKYRLVLKKLHATTACRKAGISLNFLSQFFSGKIKNPKPTKIEKLAPILGTTYNWLMFGDCKTSEVKKTDALDHNFLVKEIEKWSSSPIEKVIFRLNLIFALSEKTLEGFLYMTNILNSDWEDYLKGKKLIPINDALKLSLIFNLPLDWIYLGSSENMDDEIKQKISAIKNF